MRHLLYIDPGTGSMLFAILIGLLGAAWFGLKSFFVKLRFKLSSGKAVDASDKKIPLIIFADDKRYWTNFEPVCRELDERGIDVVYMTASENDPALNNSYEHVKAEFIGSGNKAFARLNLIKANMILSSTPGLDVYQWKRSKEVDCYVHMLHAPNEVLLYRMYGLDYYDTVLLSGKYQEEDLRDLEKARNLPAKETCMVGIPYLDESLKRLKDSGPAPEHERTVLLAPSWGPSAIFAKYGSKILDKLLETGYHIVIRPHPQSFTSEKDMIDKLMAEYPDSDRIEWNRDKDNFEVLKRSDILISDFSGVVFDFSLVHNKPIIYADTQFDTSVYDAWTLDKDLWTFKILPRIGTQLTAENMNDIKSVIDTCISDPKFAQGRDEARNETWEHMGEGAVRVCDYIENKLKEITSAESEAKK